MAKIYIEREHGMSWDLAREAAGQWAEQAKDKFDMTCTYTEGDASDEVVFKRSGVAGTLAVTDRSFALRAELGFLLSAFKDKIEAEVEKNLDALIDANSSPAKREKQ